MAEREPIGVIGAGWVGLVTAACFAELGHEVHVRDVVPEKVDALRRGEVPIFEPGLEDLLARNAERLHYTLEMGDVLPNARLLLIEGAGHIPQVEQPEVFFAAVEAFLKGAPVPGAKALGGAR